jgi:hypothetical protein
MNFTLGELVRVEAEFKNSSGVVADPTAVLFKYKKPDNTIIQLTYGVDVALVKDSVGNYHVDIDANQHNIWKWKFYSTGTVQAAKIGEFTVDDDDFN